MSQEKEKKEKLTPSLTILENSIKDWWKNLSKFIMVYLQGVIYALIPLAIILIFGLIDKFGAYDVAAFRAAAIIIAGLSVIAIFYFMIRAYMGIFLLVKKDYAGEPKTIFKETKEMFWPYFWISVLTTVFILLWTLLLIIPGIIFSVFYSFAAYAFFFEGKKGREAIRRSTQLVKGYWWPVFGRFCVVGLAAWLVTVVVSIPMYFVPENSSSYYAWNGLLQVVSFLIGPAVLLFTYTIYKDLVKIKK